MSTWKVEIGGLNAQTDKHKLGKTSNGKKRKKGDNGRLTRAKNSGRTNISRGPNQKVKCGKAKISSYSGSDERQPLKKNSQLKVENETKDKRETIR